MAVKLSSYRVSAVMDATGYTAGMAEKIAADKAGTASAVQVGAAIAANQNKVSQAGDVLTRLSRNYIEGFGAAERFTRAINTLGRGIETGNVPMERADGILDGIYRKFGLTANASELAAAGHDKLAQAVERLNTRYKATADLAERAALAQRRSAAAANFQTAINSSLGVRDDFNSAPRAADIAAYGAELDRLRARYNPLFAAVRSYRDAVAEVRQAHALGAISTDEMSAAIGRERTATLQSIAALKAKAGVVSSLSALQAQAADRSAADAARAAAAQAAQAGYNSRLGVRDDFGTVGRGEDVAAYGAELDRLRAKYNPLFSVIRQYRAEIADVRQANRLGAISEVEMTEAINRRRTATLAAIDAMKRGVAAGGSGGASSFQTANIAAQVQDTIVTSAMPGSNAAVIGLQQGPQLSAVFEQLKADGKSTGAALAAAFSSVLSPLSLITVGVVTLSALLVQTLLQGARAGETAAQALDRYAGGIKTVVAGYRAAEAAAQDFADSSGKLPIGVIEAKLGKTLAEAAKETERFKGTAYNTGIMLTTSFNKSEAAVGNLLVSFSKGETTASDLQLGLAKIGATDLGFLNFGLKGIIDSMSEGVTKAKALEEVFVSIEHALAAAAVNGGTQIALDSYVEGQRSAQSHQIELDAINAKSPAQLADIARRRVALELDSQEITESLRKQKIEEAGALAYAQASRGLADADRNRLRALNDNVAAQQLELDVVGKSVEETERLQFARQNLAAAEAEAAQNGTTVSAAYRAEVERLAAAYGKLQQQIALRKLGDDLQFDRDQLFRSPIEQTVASTLRPIFGNDLTSSQALFAANQIRINEQLKEFDDIGSNVTSGFLSTLKTELMNGTSLWGAFADAGANALQTIADKALSMAADGVWDMIFGALKGSLFGGGGFGGASVNPTTGLPALFADGGFTGMGSKYQPAGIVHRGEYVFNAGAVQRIGLANLDRLHGYADGGLVGRPYGMSAANSNWPAAGNDNVGSLEIHNHIHVPEGTNPETAPAIAREVAKELKAQLPDAIAKHNRNPLRRSSAN